MPYACVGLQSEAYVELRKPYLVNDIHMQYLLQDRRKVYDVLQQNNMPTPTIAIVPRDEEGNEEEDFEEGDVRTLPPHAKRTRTTRPPTPTTTATTAPKYLHALMHSLACQTDSSLLEFSIWMGGD